MADSEHVELLKSPDWNAWRVEHPAVAPDLTGVNLSGLDASTVTTEGDGVLRRVDESPVRAKPHFFDRPEPSTWQGSTNGGRPLSTVSTC